MKLKCFLIAIPILFSLTACQSYPSKPSKPSFWDGLEEVNKNTPTELDNVKYTVVKFHHENEVSK